MTPRQAAGEPELRRKVHWAVEDERRPRSPFVTAIGNTCRARRRARVSARKDSFGGVRLRLTVDVAASDEVPVSFRIATRLLMISVDACVALTTETRRTAITRIAAGGGDEPSHKRAPRLRRAAIAATTGCHERQRRTRSGNHEEREHECSQGEPAGSVLPLVQAAAVAYAKSAAGKKKLDSANCENGSFAMCAAPASAYRTMLLRRGRRLRAAGRAPSAKTRLRVEGEDRCQREEHVRRGVPKPIGTLDAVALATKCERIKSAKMLMDARTSGHAKSDFAVSRASRIEKTRRRSYENACQVQQLQLSEAVGTLEEEEPTEDDEQHAARPSTRRRSPPRVRREATRTNAFRDGRTDLEREERSEDGEHDIAGDARRTFPQRQDELRRVGPRGAYAHANPFSLGTGANSFAGCRRSSPRRLFCACSSRSLLNPASARTPTVSIARRTYPPAAPVAPIAICPGTTAPVPTNAAETEAEARPLQPRRINVRKKRVRGEHERHRHEHHLDDRDALAKSAPNTIGTRLGAAQSDRGDAHRPGLARTRLSIPPETPRPLWRGTGTARCS